MLCASQHGLVTVGREAAEELMLRRRRDGSKRLHVVDGTIRVGAEADLRIAGSMTVGEMRKPVGGSMRWRGKRLC